MRARDLLRRLRAALGYRRGFYGLIADGWDIEDFAKPWPKGPIPEEAQEVELIVGFFDTERRSLTQMSETEFNDHAVRYLEARGSTKAGSLCIAPRLTADQIESVRRCRADLFTRWGQLAPGEALELSFQR